MNLIFYTNIFSLCMLIGGDSTTDEVFVSTSSVQTSQDENLIPDEVYVPTLSVQKSQDETSIADAVFVSTSSVQTSQDENSIPDEVSVQTSSVQMSQDENSIPTPFMRHTGPILGPQQSTIKVGLRKRHLKWRNEAISRLKERYGNAFEASTFKIKDEEMKPTPMIMNNNATGRDKRESINAHLLDLFGRNDTEKKRILEAENSPRDMYGPCYMSNFKAFMKHCYPTIISYRYGGLLYVKNLIARACKVDWLVNQEIKDIILATCSVRRRYALEN